MTELTALPGMIELCYCTGSGGRKFYAVLDIPASRYLEYQNARLLGGQLDLESFGTVLTSGWGEPDAAAIAMLKNAHIDNGEFETQMRSQARAIIAANEQRKFTTKSEHDEQKSIG